MKFNFKIQQYQTDAVDAVVKVFQGQGYHDRISYIRDVGKRQANQQMRLNIEMDQQYSWDTGEECQLNIYDLDDDDTGYKNEVVELTDDQLLINMILSRLVDTFSSRILYPMLPFSVNHSIAVV